MTFKGLIDFRSFLSQSEKAHYSQAKKMYVETSWAEWLSTFSEIGPLTPETGPFSAHQPDQESTNGPPQEPISNEIKDLHDSKNVCFFSKNPEGLSPLIAPAHSAQSNEIKDLDAKTPAAAAPTPPRASNGAAERIDDEFSDVNLPPSVTGRELIAAIPGAHGGENDVSFGCPFFRQKYCDAHALRIERQWSFACDYTCKSPDMIQALAENNPAFAELVRTYGIHINGGGLVDGGIPFFITQGMRAELHYLGYADEEIDRLKPAEAHEILREKGWKP